MGSKGTKRLHLKCTLPEKMYFAIVNDRHQATSQEFDLNEVFRTALENGLVSIEGKPFGLGLSASVWDLFEGAKKVDLSIPVSQDTLDRVSKVSKKRIVKTNKRRALEAYCHYLVDRNIFIVVNDKLCLSDEASALFST